MSTAGSTWSLMLLATMAWTAGCKAAPISITQGDMEAVFAPGRTFRLFMDSTSRPVSVGVTGGPNTYDFRGLTFVPYDSVSMLAVTQVPADAPRGVASQDRQGFSLLDARGSRSPHRLGPITA